MTCRCRVLEADIEEIERDRDDAFALLRRLRNEVAKHHSHWTDSRLLVEVQERFPELAR